MDLRNHAPAGTPAQAGGPNGPNTPELEEARRSLARRKLLIRWGIGLGLVLLTVVAYWGVWNLDFVYFDDPGYVSQNLFVQRGLTWENVKWAFTSFFQSNWHPLSWLSHMADCQIFSSALDEQGHLRDAGGHHVTNLLFHVANTLLLFLLLWRMTGATWRSGLVAALFAVHPLHVESVAWVAERKDVLSTFLGLLTLHAYIGYARRPMSAERTRWVGAASLWVGIVWLAVYLKVLEPILDPRYGSPSLPLGRALWGAAALTLPVLAVYGYLSWRFLLVIVGLAVGLLAKPMLVTLPFVCLLLDYWPLKRVPAIGWPWGRQPEPQPQGRTGPQVARRARAGRRSNAAPGAAPAQKPARQSFLAAVAYLVMEKLPLFLLVIASARVTYYAQRVGGAMAEEGQFSLAARLENAGWAYWGYISKMFWPRNLACLYMLPAEQHPWQGAVMWAVWIGVTIAIVCLAAWRGWRYLAVGWLWYLGTLVPVIGLVQVGDQRMADRYAYIPLVGLFLMAAWGAGALIGRTAGAMRTRLTWAAAVVALSLLGICIGVTHHQLQFWHDRKTVLEHAIEVDDRNCKAHNNLGVALWEWRDGQIKQARILQADPRGARRPRSACDRPLSSRKRRWSTGGSAPTSTATTRIRTPTWDTSCSKRARPKRILPGGTKRSPRRSTTFAWRLPTGRSCRNRTTRSAASIGAGPTGRGGRQAARGRGQAGRGGRQAARGPGPTGRGGRRIPRGPQVRPRFDARPREPRQALHLPQEME